MTMKLVDTHEMKSFEGLRLNEYDNGSLFGVLFLNGNYALGKLAQDLDELENEIVELGFESKAIRIEPDHDGGMFNVMAKR